ncbi:HAMP domain-containing sensor histidine kinase [Nitrosophilus labii]|uniref:HAMP domain-containing sensor histidine kinase n=1 Tax=Nitrosophilus labii TaxID=2706014 RepID=UPI0016572E24|nr:ATP-binding protein [Nitrosophilus labii]
MTSVFIFFISKNLVLPIKSLYETAHYIVKTGDYNKEIYSNRQDEIGNLTKIFNILIKKTKESLDSIKAQSKKYEESLIDLIEFFNTITKTESKYDTITVAVRELKRLMNTQDIFFTNDKREFKNAFVLGIDVKNFKKNRIENLGKIVIFNPTNQITNLNRFYNSIKQMISLQIERISLMEELKEALRAKSSFLSAMSHELKTPIGSILSLSQYLLTSSKLDQNNLESISKIEHSANHLLQIINDILTIAKVDSGKIDMEISKTDISNTVKEVLDILNPLAESKGIKIINNIKEELKINTDPKLFKIVIINLISNAIKFTPKGNIYLSLKKEGNDYKIYIKDCGIGIDKEDLKYIFDEFYQGKIYKSGTGLGLSISKKFATLLKGDINIHSEGIGKGTTSVFVFSSF